MKRLSGWVLVEGTVEPTENKIIITAGSTFANKAYHSSRADLYQEVG
jgi:hypothetical protein